MKITVTGGSGFLGSHVADELSKIGHKVKIFDKKKSRWLMPTQKMCIGSILNFKSLENVIKGSDVIYHFAALSDIEKAMKNPLGTVRNNILGTVNVLELMRKHKIKKLIYASTIYVNSVSGGFYRTSKKATEDYINEYSRIYDFNYKILRFGSVYGERSDYSNGVKRIITDAISTGKVSYYGNKNYIREYIHVSDAAKACSDLLNKKYKNKYINITGKRKIKVKFLLKLIARLLKIKKSVEFRNEMFTGHYTTTPYTYKQKIGKKFNFKSLTNFGRSIEKLVSEIKKEKN